MLKWKVLVCQTSQKVKEKGCPLILRATVHVSVWPWVARSLDPHAAPTQQLICRNWRENKPQFQWNGPGIGATQVRAKQRRCHYGSGAFEGHFDCPFKESPSCTFMYNSSHIFGIFLSSFHL